MAPPEAPKPEPPKELAAEAGKEKLAAPGVSVDIAHSLDEDPSGNTALAKLVDRIEEDGRRIIDTAQKRTDEAKRLLAASPTV